MSVSLTNHEILLNTVEEAIADIKAGKVVIVVDDEDRENEGDFICAAQCVTPEIINFMATHGRGLICAPLDERRVEELGLPMMVQDNTALHETAFTVSIDLIGHGCTTGISAHDRASCVRALVDPKVKSEDFARPGHIFPLKAKTGGVLRRTGHTEAAIDLARLAGFYPAGVLVEILNEDGTMARLPQLIEIAARHDLKVISIKDLVSYRMRHERIVNEVYSTHLDTQFGQLEVKVFNQITTGDTHLAVIRGNIKNHEPVLVRVHSSMGTGDLLANLLDDNSQVMQKAMDRIVEEGTGVILFMRHGDGESIINQLKNWTGQTVPHGAPQRDFGIGAQILRELNICKIKLLSRHPRKRIGLEGYGLEIVEVVQL
ncbi:MAG: 3,4-dihydroxy-2-butanone-4-phosphate synthase [Saprospiraceae bacterium]|nr:3,4-dihydroxy-2-butanone-4-phosphate synthase [Saprospiraceae bacterium]MCB9318732.1 3,4-dihydroxy-2-butanone-4-phosphate synthase [Lewinellaceae bacterium]